jgi:hypothetical protein
MEICGSLRLCRLLFFGDSNFLEKMKFKYILLLIGVITLQGCPKVYYSPILFQVQNDLDENLTVKIYNTTYPYYTAKDTILTINPREIGTFGRFGMRGEVSDYIEEFGGRLQIFDSIIVIRDGVFKSKKSFDKKVDWRYVEVDPNNAYYLLIIKKEDF